MVQTNRVKSQRPSAKDGTCSHGNAARECGLCKLQRDMNARLATMFGKPARSVTPGRRRKADAAVSQEQDPGQQRLF